MFCPHLVLSKKEENFVLRNGSCILHITDIRQPVQLKCREAELNYEKEKGISAKIIKK